LFVVVVQQRKKMTVSEACVVVVVIAVFIILVGYPTAFLARHNNDSCFSYDCTSTRENMKTVSTEWNRNTSNHRTQCETILSCHSPCDGTTTYPGGWRWASVCNDNVRNDTWSVYATMGGLPTKTLVFDLKLGLITMERRRMMVMDVLSLASNVLQTNTLSILDACAVRLRLSSSLNDYASMIQRGVCESFWNMRYIK
jgi:hypothetical protein